MATWLRRALTFAGFTLREYARSGRILVEILSLVVVLWVLFWPRGSQGMGLDQFFNLAGLYLMVLSAYTTSMLMRLGRRPQGYVLLARPLGRAGYFAGLFCASLVVSAAVYLFLSLAVPPLNGLKGQPLNLEVVGWLLGTIPLALDVVVVSAFMALLSPLVLSNWPRLALLAVLALALTTDLQWLGSQNIGALLQPFQTALGLVLAPVLGGFELAIARQYDLAAAGILAGQVALAVFLLAAALLAFRRRELILIS